MYIYKYKEIQRDSSRVSIEITKYQVKKDKSETFKGCAVVHVTREPTNNCQVLSMSPLSEVINLCAQVADDIRDVIKNVITRVDNYKKFILFDVYDYHVASLTAALGEPYTISSYKSQYDWDIQMSMGLYWIPGKSEDDYEGDGCGDDDDEDW